MVKVSIIMPVYNGAEFLEKSVESVSKQTLEDIELICIDDGSEDNSLEILNELKEKYSFIRILTQENQGSGKARNYGMDEAEGEYIGFLDADDIFVDKYALQKMYELGHKNNANMVGANLKELLPDGDLVYNSNYTGNNYYEFEAYERIKPKEYGVPWAFYKNIYKKSFLDKNEIRFRDLIRGQDPVFMAEVLANLEDIYGVPLVLYAYLFPVEGKPFIKVNTHKKKLHYITHYKMTFDVFEENGLKNLSEKYKPKFLNYLRFSRNTKDLETYEIVMDLFGKENHYFDNFKNEFDLFKIAHLLNKINVVNTGEFFNQAKAELETYDIWTNDMITPDIYRVLTFIATCDTFADYKKGFSEINIINLKEEKKKLTSKNKSLAKKNKKLKSSLKYNKNKYNTLANSTTMNFANYFKKDSKPKKATKPPLKERFLLKTSNAYVHHKKEHERLTKENFKLKKQIKAHQEKEIQYDKKIDSMNKDFRKKLNELKKVNKKLDNLSKLDKIIKQNKFLKTKIETASNRVLTNRKISNQYNRELEFAHVFNDTIRQSEWLVKKDFSLINAAANYSLVYSLYRILDEVRPVNILELGLGQSSKITSQYANHFDDVKLTIIEGDDVWIDSFSKKLKLTDNIKICQRDIEKFEYNDTENLRFKDMSEIVGDTKYDLIIIDGPNGFIETPEGKVPIEYSRSNIWQMIPNNLMDDFVIIMDDFHREGEQNTMTRVKELLDENNITYYDFKSKGLKDQCAVFSENYRYISWF